MKEIVFFLVLSIGVFSFQKSFSSEEKELRVRNVVLNYTDTAGLNFSNTTELEKLLGDLDSALNASGFYAKEFPAEWRKHIELKFKNGSERWRPYLDNVASPLRIVLKTGPKIPGISYGFDRNQNVQHRAGTRLQMRVWIGENYYADTHFVVYEGRPQLDQLFSFFSDYLWVLAVRHNTHVLAKLDESFVAFITNRISVLQSQKIGFGVEYRLQREARDGALHVLRSILDGLVEARSKGFLAKQLAWSIAAYNSSGSREVSGLTKYVGNQHCALVLR